MPRFLRIARVILGVTAGCVLAGAAAGVFVALMLDLILAGPRGMFFDGETYLYASVVGGACGFLLGPAAAFGFLRRVPLGRLFAETALGAALGGLIGFAFVRDIVADLLIAAVGFALAVAQLAWRYRRKGEADQQIAAS
ncbi:MAG TPA: hypothetical protein VJO52_12485 [Gemmatimonadaceae bacterium]|nr:hypothetical protein [Gemmatimonadaceae bacterium]